MFNPSFICRPGNKHCRCYTNALVQLILRAFWSVAKSFCIRGEEMLPVHDYSPNRFKKHIFFKEGVLNHVM